VIFGFMTELLKLATKFETNKFAFAWDSKKSIRKVIYSDYKYKRAKARKEKTKEEKVIDKLAYEQFHLIRKEVLPLFGFKNNFIRTGHEADDIIANILLNNKKKERKFIIVSNDEDLYQLLNKASIYSLGKKRVITKDEFESEYNISCDRWAEVKSIAGCSTDSVEGVRGVGEKTAIKYLNGELKKGVALERIKNSSKIINRNSVLVTLPLQINSEDGMDPIKLKFKNEEFTLRDFHIMCDKYGFYSFKSATNYWVKKFRMV